MNGNAHFLSYIKICAWKKRKQ